LRCPATGSALETLATEARFAIRETRLMKRHVTLSRAGLRIEDLFDLFLLSL